MGKQKKLWPPKYCRKCGKKLVTTVRTSTNEFNTQTGKPIQITTLACPDFVLGFDDFENGHSGWIDKD